jgi:hypothetical protein
MKGRFLTSFLGAAILAGAAFGQGQADQQTGQQQGQQADQQRHIGSGGWGQEAQLNRMYEQENVRTISGRIVAILERRPLDGMDEGMSMTVRPDDGEAINIDLGPMWYLERQELNLRVGDRVEVTGAQVELNGEPMMLAANVVKDNRVMYLRDVRGTPIWAAWGPRAHIEVMADPRVQRQQDQQQQQQQQTQQQQQQQTHQQTQMPPADMAEHQIFEGRLVGVEVLQQGQAGVPSSVLVIDSPTGLVRVDLGPQWFIQRQDMTFGIGDQVRIFSPPVQMQQGTGVIAPPIIATGVLRGNEFMRLWWPTGQPMWQSPWWGP